MKMVKLLVVIGVAYMAFNYYQNNMAFDHPIAGEWQSDKKKSLNEWYKIGVTAQQETVLKEILGKLKLTVSKNTWTIDDGNRTQQGKYEIVSEKNDCYVVRYQGGAESEVCVKEGDLYVTPVPRSPKLGTEVFVKVN